MRGVSRRGAGHRDTTIRLGALAANPDVGNSLAGRPRALVGHVNTTVAGRNALRTAD